MEVLEGKSKDYFGLQGVVGWSLRGANKGSHDFFNALLTCVPTFCCMHVRLRLVLPSVCMDLHEKVFGCPLLSITTL